MNGLNNISPKPTYDPKVVQAVQESNLLDDTPDENLTIGALTPENMKASRAFHTTQDRERLKSLLPGISDLGIDQLKTNVRRGVGLQNISQPTGQ